MRHRLLVAGLVLVAGTAAGCGGGPPTDAPTADFCQVFEDFDKAADELGEDPGTDERVELIEDFAKELEDVGTPDGISEDARAGFEVTIQAIEDIPADATEDEIGTYFDEALSEEEQKQSDAFDEYVTETCESE